MALNPKLSNLAASAEADAVMRLLDAGFVDIYDGTQPATADTAVSTQVKLAHLTIGNPSAPAAVNGVATYNAITADSDADATGTAAWFRATKTDGTAVYDGSVGTTGCNLNLNSTAIQIHAAVSISSFTYTAQKG